MTPSIIRSLVVRHMRRTSGFTQWKSGVEIPDVIPIPEGEEVVGWYRNPAPFGNVLVLFTVSAIHVAEGRGFVTIRLADIVDYDMPESKQTADGVRVRTADGCEFVRIAGSHGAEGKFRDAFSLVSVLHALVRPR